MADSDGISFAVSTAGGKSSSLEYRVDGKEMLLTLGKLPALTLSRARELAALARANKAEGCDPRTLKRHAVAVAITNADASFESIALELHPKLTAVLAKRHHTISLPVRNEISPALGKLPISAITVPMLFAQLERIQKRSEIETGRRMRRPVEDIFSYAIRTGRADQNPVAELAKTLTGIPLINVVRNVDQAELLLADGAVCPTARRCFEDRLTESVAEMRATLCFDPIGGAKNASIMLAAMEAAAARGATAYNRWRPLTLTHDQAHLQTVRGAVTVPRIGRSFIWPLR